MKKSTLYVILLMAVMTAPAFELKAQWLTNGNVLSGAGLLGSTSNHAYSLITNNTQRIRLMANGNIQLGSNAVLNATPANYAQFDDDGDLRFFGTGSYLVPSNAYAFRWEGDEDIGLFFSAANSRYEFRDNAANAVFHVTSGGDVRTSGNLDLDGNITMDFDGSILIGTLGTTDARIAIHEGVDASLGAGGLIVLGPEAGVNLAIDANEIMSRNNGSTSTFFIQNEGGDTWFGGNNNSTVDLVVEDEGRIGIRTTTPSRELEIVHGSSSGSLYGLMIANEEANNQDWTLYTNNSDGDLSFYQNGLFAGEFSDLDGIYTPSDSRLKTNVKNMEPLLSRLMKLEPKTFTYIKSEHPDKTHIGFIAQEMEKQFPEIVGRAGEDQDTYVMNYSMLSVLAIKAIQEQQELIEEKDQQIATLQSAVAELQSKMKLIAQSFPELQSKSDAGQQMKTNEVELSSARLDQNVPNPFDQSTTISYYIPESSVSASIEIISSMGKILKSIPVQEKGKGQVILKPGELSAGTYAYQLVINGKAIDTKQMIIVK